MRARPIYRAQPTRALQTYFEIGLRSLVSAFLLNPIEKCLQKNFLMWQETCLFNRYHESHEAARGGEKAWMPANDAVQSGRCCASGGTIRSRIWQRNSTYAHEPSAMMWRPYRFLTLWRLSVAAMAGASSCRTGTIRRAPPSARSRSPF